MAKLSEEILVKGRQLVVAEDLEGINAWVREYAPLIDRKVVSDTFQKTFLAHDSEKSLKMFDAAFVEYDTADELRGVAVRLIWPTLKLLGLLGGVAYLVHLLFGH